MPATPASTSGTLNAGSHYQLLKLSLATISCTLAMAGSRICACISQYQTETASNGVPSDQIKYFKARLQWEMNYSASENIVTSVFAYTCPWWMGNSRIPDQPWQWDEIMASCVSHYQYWVLNVEDDSLVLPEKLKNTSSPPLMGLRWIKEHMEVLIEEQDEGIQAKMAEVKMYTDMLEKLRKGKGVLCIQKSCIQVQEAGVPSPEFWSLGLGNPELGNCVGCQGIRSIGDHMFPEAEVPSPEFQSPGFGDLELGNCVGCQGIQSIGDHICIRDLVFRTMSSPKSRVLSPELRALSPKLRNPHAGLGTRSSGLNTFLNTESLYFGTRDSKIRARSSGLGTQHCSAY
ncbi:uncharacterized protein F5891DRAFT_979766 [Suillus fuscotomentosus]|uniref:Uncharacterized protein n=1 Tax=Suillus fuscotomentosus TaxID=1912939 RepID=A0AAD4E7U7_9AGAM|nr:uncharacterized protein F5891DRAFT_979766 [Suillus fuscotomentosus]KAG1901236.1 hypothetical protein F5891DRAFT_979766 [Suillus fuscotomentosus]